MTRRARHLRPAHHQVPLTILLLSHRHRRILRSNQNIKESDQAACVQCRLGQRAASGRIGLFGRAIRPARSTTRGSEAEIAWKVAFGCFSLTGGKPNGECRFRERTLVSVSGIAGGITFSTLTRYPHKHPQFGGITSDANKQHQDNPVANRHLLCSRVRKI